MEIYERVAILTFADSEHIDNRCALGLNLEVIWTGDFRSAAFLFCNYMDASSSFASASQRGTDAFPSLTIIILTPTRSNSGSFISTAIRGNNGIKIRRITQLFALSWCWYRFDESGPLVLMFGAVAIPLPSSHGIRSLIHLVPPVFPRPNPGKRRWKKKSRACVFVGTSVEMCSSLRAM